MNMEPDSLGSSDQGEGSSGGIRSDGPARLGRFEALVLLDGPVLIVKDKVVIIEGSGHRGCLYHRPSTTSAGVAEAAVVQ